MCGRYILVQKLEVIEQRFNARTIENINYSPSYNISPGKKGLIIINESVKKIESAIFGLTPHWSMKPMYLFNARAEGDRNQENDSNYRGAKQIILKPAFRKSIRHKRCLVIADAFIEGTTQEGLSKPYVVFLRNKQLPFAFAGIYDDWENPQTGQIIRGYSIITTVANEFMKKIPHNRCPVILKPADEDKWLNPSLALTDVTDMLEAPDSNTLNAYPVSPNIKNPNLDGPDLIQPIGDFLVCETDINVHETLKRQGFGRNHRNF